MMKQREFSSFFGLYFYLILADSLQINSTSPHFLKSAIIDSYQFQNDTTRWLKSSKLEEYPMFSSKLFNKSSTNVTSYISKKTNEIKPTATTLVQLTVPGGKDISPSKKLKIVTNTEFLSLTSSTSNKRNSLQTSANILHSMSSLSRLQNNSIFLENKSVFTSNMILKTSPSRSLNNSTQTKPEIMPSLYMYTSTHVPVASVSKLAIQTMQSSNSFQRTTTLSMQPNLTKPKMASTEKDLPSSYQSTSSFFHSSSIFTSNSSRVSSSVISSSHSYHTYSPSHSIPFRVHKGQLSSQSNNYPATFTSPVTKSIIHSTSKSFKQKEHSHFPSFTSHLSISPKILIQSTTARYLFVKQKSSVISEKISRHETEVTIHSVTPSPTPKNNINDTKLKERKRESLPVWILILTAAGAFLVITVISAVAFKFVKWNKDHGDYTLWVPNIELKPVNARNAEVLT